MPVTDAPHVAGFVASQTKDEAKVYTEDAAVYNALKGAFDHESVNHSASEYVRDQAHTNGIESLWSDVQAWLREDFPQDVAQAS